MRIRNMLSHQEVLTSNRPILIGSGIYSEIGNTRLPEYAATIFPDNGGWFVVSHGADIKINGVQVPFGPVRLYPNTYFSIQGITYWFTDH